MKNKKIVILIGFFLFFGFFLSPRKAFSQYYACNASCALNPAGCAAPRICVSGFCRNPSCTSEASCICPTATPTPTPTPTPGPWIKLKNSSFISKNNLTVDIPLIPIIYDAADDTTQAFFIIGEAGVVAAPAINITHFNPAAKTGNPEYKAIYTPAYSMTPALFLSYIKARKEYIVITNLGEITGSGIYVYNGALTGSSALTNSNFTTSNVVLIATGDIEINETKFNSSDCISATKSAAILSTTGTISFADTTQCAAGIFIANTIETGANTNQGLKIIGNLIAQTSLVNNREWPTNSQPSLFIKFDQTKYINLLPYLSTANYQWREIQ